MPHVHRSQEDAALASGPRRHVLSRRALLDGAFGSLALLAACSAVPPLLTPTPSADNQAGRSPAGATPAAPGQPTATTEAGSGSAGAQAVAATPGEASPVALAVAPTAAPAAAAAATCALSAAVAPTSVPYPGYTLQEPSTGLHVTGEAYEVDLASYRLKVSGKVDHPLSLTYDDLRCLPKTQARVSLECPGFFIDQQTLAGPTLATLLALAGPQAAATTVMLSSAQPYTMNFALAEAQDAKNFLAYEWEGQALPRSHGFPLRGVFPGRPGSNWVKWLVEIELL
jgi:DMSO/TMAO reductase YedYZ molybdopterin-dependent catalytic subunit